MEFSEIALRMFPYWIMGIFMIFVVYKSQYKDLLKIQWNSVGKWLMVLGGLTLYRIAIFSWLKNNAQLQEMTSGAMTIPWQATLTVFWEDACHTLPLVIFSRWLGKDKLWKKILSWASIAFVMVSFGLGHVYQGYLAAAFLSCYIPYTFKKGQEVGFGTVMICHTLYDLVTILTIRLFLG